MTTVQIKDLKNHLNQTVTLQGWLYNKRSSGKIHFLQLRDGTGFIQAILAANNENSRQMQLAETLSMESSLNLTGQVTAHPKLENTYELQVQDLKVINLADEDYPIAKKEHGIDFLMQQRHLWLRSSRQWAIQRIRNTIIYATYEFFGKHGWIKFDSPILTPNACEGTTELFELDYFDLGKAYLSQSGQLYLEAAIMSLGKAWDFGPVFRAENSNTRRHLTEFWMMDAEAAFVEHEENLKIQEGLICAIVEKVLQDNRQELNLLERNIEALEKVKAPFIRMTHAAAVKELQAMGSDIADRDDLGADDETMLTKKYDKPIFVEKYPIEIKAFYMKPDPKDPTRVLNADLLAPEGYGEVIGGSQREDDYEKLLARITEHKLDPATFSWYLDLRKFGSVPHSGFGYGLERLVTWICGLDHVRESIPFARTPNRLTP